GACATFQPNPGSKKIDACSKLDGVFAEHELNFFRTVEALGALMTWHYAADTVVSVAKALADLSFCSMYTARIL
ncbi:MAG: hypothetical protein AAF732_17160, partial [Pseudomonadota bacterium]